MSGLYQVPNTFDTAVAAFEIRFEEELDSGWRDLAGKTRDAIIGEGLEIDAHPVEKYRLLWHFCDDAGDGIAAVVSEYFRTLLDVATAQREHLGGPSPLSWTEAKILTLVCNFLAMDEGFDETSTPRESSRVLGTVERIITGGKYPDDGPSPEFCLPGWANMTPTQLMQPLRFDYQPTDSTEPPLSRADTLEWVKWKELVVLNGLKRQISDCSLKASLDGMIEAGKNGNPNAIPSKTAPLSAGRSKMPNYRSEIKNLVFGRLAQHHDASDRQLCDWLDETGNVELPSSWSRHSNRSFASAYADKKVKPLMESRFSQVRGDMRAVGYNIP
jgi:hypothetical protein